MKSLAILMVYGLGMASTAFADRNGGVAGGWLPEWPNETTLFDNEQVKRMGVEKEIWFGECRSKTGEGYPYPEKNNIMALGVISIHKAPYGQEDFAQTKFYVYPLNISAKQYVRIMASQGDPNQGEELYPEAESLVHLMRERYEADFKFGIQDVRGKAFLKDDGSWQWYERDHYDYNSATFSLKSFCHAANKYKPILYLSVEQHNPKELKVERYQHCIFSHKRGPLSMMWW